MFQGRGALVAPAAPPPGRDISTKCPQMRHGNAPRRAGAGEVRIGLIDEFVDYIRDGRQPLINLRWHRQTIKAMLGCYTSIQTGRIAKIGR